jgi:spore germination cell wall hydrolase CwlJ-like protein
MKTKTILIAAALCVALALPVSAQAGAVRMDKQHALHEAAEILRAAGYDEDAAPIRALQSAWQEEQEALDITARVVMGEAPYCPYVHQVAIAAVVVNRVNSDRFPDTVREVVSQPGQYSTIYLRGFDKTLPRCYEAAKTALDGDDEVPDDVVWQANFPQGRSVWWTSYVDTGWWRSVTYFCR